MLEIAIADEGIGIPANCHGKVFQIFHRLHDRSAYPGTGIGLAIVKKGVDLHQGEIAIQSTEGSGTTFVIRLPVIHPDKRALSSLPYDIGGTDDHPQ
jgi:signal transduction histidine kinase